MVDMPLNQTKSNETIIMFKLYLFPFKYGSTQFLEPKSKTCLLDNTYSDNDKPITNEINLDIN